MSSPHATFERNRQDREAMVSEALKLRAQGVPYSSMAERLGVSKSQAETLTKTSDRMSCRRCGEGLRNPVPEDLCGFCIFELAHEGLAA